MDMTIKEEERGACTLLSVAGRLDAVTAAEFDRACGKLLESGKDNVVVDCGGLSYISSAGLRSILALAKKLKATGGDLRFCGLSGMVNEVFMISGFQNMFTIAATFEEL